MNYLITGAAGFVGRYLESYLNIRYSDIKIWGTDIAPSPYWEENKRRRNFICTNLLNISDIESLIDQTEPDKIIHLASYSSVAYSWNNPVDCFLNNSLIFLNLLEIIRKKHRNVCLLSIGSSEEYGNVQDSEIPICEEHELSGTSPYAVARISQEMLSKVFSSGYGLDIRMTRSFNHIGPYQKENFVISGFIKQFVEAEIKGEKEVKLKVGNLNVIRDFTDVRDVVKAYDAIIEKGKINEVYNVCSGNGYLLSEIIEKISMLMNMKFSTVNDKEKIRPIDNYKIIGSNLKIFKECGWKPEISINDTIIDTIEYWRKTLRKSTKI